MENQWVRIAPWSLVKRVVAFTRRRHLDRQPGAGHFGLYGLRSRSCGARGGKTRSPDVRGPGVSGQPRAAHSRRAYEARLSDRLIESQESGGHFEVVLLRPKVTVESGDVQEAPRLPQDAHKKCFIANSVNFSVLLEPAIQHASKAGAWGEAQNRRFYVSMSTSEILMWRPNCS
jgi:hypothetical protein